ncbi:hypothetical protein I203_100680 [Kwoniella mangroviensis CBS 8507]|uniref:uncharacterized protein n=1 Tax=Kwoniella mangroviensis CBS 8507 TaxID=1296122 RepID=UPI00080D28D5|nr:uncharacterized protein I203_06785 [Kwoniella mangroviensis CBS 8507]OCF64201.1 hypothetical protein I203_06785 [Kwoniella mangroviensis CBS 8507]
MPPRRSSRTSLSSPTGADDISYLTLAEVRDRLNRNNALLSSPLFATPQVGAAGPSSDPVKDKLLLAREALLAREQELMLDNMHLADQDTQQQQIYNGSPPKSPTLSLGGGGNGRSGKARVLNRIREGESNLAKNGLILPIDQTLHLGQRDYQNATALSLSHLSLNPTRSSSPKPRSARPKVSHPSNLYDNVPVGGEDEITRANRLARINAFMSYKSSSSDSEDDDDDFDQDDDVDEEGMEGIDKEEYINRLIRSQSQLEEKNFPLTGNASGGYDGNGQPLHNDDKSLDDLGEEVDVYGEDDEDFLEGNDEYANGAGQGSMAAGPGR